LGISLYEDSSEEENQTRETGNEDYEFVIYPASKDGDSRGFEFAQRSKAQPKITTED
jgi:hypothetical protein